MIDIHLGSGYDVVVPQLLARPDFIEQLEEVAAAAGAEFVEIALDVTRAVAISAFEERRQAPTHSTHRDASDLVERSRSADPVGEIYDALRTQVGDSDCHASVKEPNRVLGDDLLRAWSMPTQQLTPPCVDARLAQAVRPVADR